MSSKIKEFRSSRVLWDSTRQLFSEAVGCLPHSRLLMDFSGIAHLSPFSSALSDIQAVFQEVILLDDKVGCYIPPDVSTPVVYAKKNFGSETGLSIIKNSILPVFLSRLSGKGLGYSTLVANFLHELKTQFPEQPLANLHPLFRKALYDKEVPDTLSHNIDEVFSILIKLEGFLSKKSLITEDDAVNLFTPKSLCSVLILEGFTAPLPAEKSVILKMCEKAENIFIASPTVLLKNRGEDPLTVLISEHLKQKGIQFKRSFVMNDAKHYHQEPVCCPAEGIVEEVECIARSIKSLYLSGMNRCLNNVVIAATDIKSYAPVAERVLVRYGIPCSLSISSSPMPEPFSDLSAMLRSVADDYSRIQFTNFLSSRFFRNIPASVSDNIQRLSPLSGVISGSAAWISFIRNGTDTFNTEILESREAIEEGFEKIFGILQPLWSLRKQAEPGQYAELVMLLLDQLGFDPKNSQLQKHIAEIMDLMVFSAESFPGRICLQDFIDIIEYLFLSARPDNDKKGVRVMDMYEAAGLCPKYLYVCGMTEQKIPSLPDMDYLLPDAVKRQLGLKDMDRHMEIQKTLFEMLISSAAHVTLSYPEMEKENPLLPSPFLYGIPVVRQKMPGIYSEEELQLSQPLDGIADNIPEMLLGTGIYPRESFIRVTDIDAYRACPRKCFIDKVLKLGPAEIKKFEIEPLTIGNISHTIMERLIKEPLGSYDSFEQRACSIAKEALESAKINDYWKDIFHDAFAGILPELYENELDIRDKDYKRSVLEMNISGEPVEGLRVKGKIDRFDVLGDSAQVIDYKSGNASLNCSQAMSGKENLQLFLYAAMLKQKDSIEIKRVGIYSLSKIKVKWCPSQYKGKKKEQSGDMQIYITEALKAALEAVNNMQQGSFPAVPVNDHNCMNCHESAFCPYINRI
ncbi:MAG: PD-(D/E)XK nuclease family protein [Nitrospirae bacterium]|nr:PD-(D/E)XK nuclease family protein [Nitrospirota bacterium]